MTLNSLGMVGYALENFFAMTEDRQYQQTIKEKSLYYIPSIDFLLFCNKIVLVSYGVKWFTSGAYFLRDYIFVIA